MLFVVIAAVAVALLRVSAQHHTAVPQLMVQSSYPDDRPTDFAKKYQIIDKRHIASGSEKSKLDTSKIPDNHAKTTPIPVQSKHGGIVDMVGLEDMLSWGPKTWYEDDPDDFDNFFRNTAKGKAEGKLEPVRVKPAGERLRQLVKAIVEECEKDKPNVFLKDNCPNMVSNFNSMHNYLLRIVTSNTV